MLHLMADSELFSSQSSDETGTTVAATKYSHYPVVCPATYVAVRASSSGTTNKTRKGKHFWSFARFITLNN
jgi:hypothetical protein